MLIRAKRCKFCVIVHKSTERHNMSAREMRADFLLFGGQFYVKLQEFPH